MVRQSTVTANGFELLRWPSLVGKKREASKESFDRLLGWLSPDREEAGRHYEQIRRRLIKIFTGRCCTRPEELADETMDRVLGKIDQVICNFEGDPALYFYGVAKNVFREFVKERRVFEPPPPGPPDSPGPELDCLDECLDRLTARSREMLLGYYQEEKQAKIANRKRMAAAFGMDMNALRIRVHRIRSVVAECTTACLRKASV
jgi:DNA-directed RNA polymerase specialized sigma24 family protein